MRGFKTLALVATASVLLAGSLQAQWTGTMKWGGIKSPSLTGSFRIGSASNTTNQKTVFVSPYLASFKIPIQTPALNPALLPPAGTTTFGAIADIFCVDYLHWANTGEYAAKFTNLANYAAEGGKTRLGTGGLNQYLKAAWLAQEIAKGTYSNADRLSMNGAIWQIMSGQDLFLSVGGSYSNGNDLSGIHYWADHRANAAEVNAANWVVVTDQGANGGDHQEFITQVTPEPATMLLLGTGLVVMLMAAGALRRPVA